MWKQLKTNRNTNNVDISTSQFYETFKRQSQPPALDMFETNFMFTISNDVTKNNIIITTKTKQNIVFQTHSERKNYEK